MDTATYRVSLADAAGGVVSAGEVAVVLPRSGVEAARSAGDGAQLVLEIAHEDAGQLRTDSLAVDWSSDDLERLLAVTPDDITIAIDRDQLIRALDQSDVEGHGLRERVLVVSAVVATMGMGASVAQARPTGLSPTGQPIRAVASESSTPTSGFGVSPIHASVVAAHPGGSPTVTGTATIVPGGRGAARPVNVSGQSVSVPTPSPEDAALIAAGGLALLAAAFTVGRRRHPATPA